MGSKNIKAIAIRGTKGPEMANPDGLKEFRQWLLDNPKRYATFSDYGTGAAMEAYVTIGNTPIRNFRDGEFDTSGISAIAVKDKIRIAMEGCYACRVRCKKIVKVDEPNMKVDPAYGGPEYETLAAFGNNCGVDDLKAIAKGHELCNAYSLDTISTGMTISFAMECYENGLLSNKETGGLDLRFGNTEAMLRAIELIARREGIGDLLAEGSLRMAEKIGQGAEKYAMHVKGQEIPMHDPRCKAALGLGYEINPHGADHVANFQDTNFTKPGAALDGLHPLGVLEPLPAEDLGPRKVQLFHHYHNYRLLADHMVVCCFVPYSLEQYVNIVKAATGWDTGMVELLRIADRTLTLDRMYNLRENFTTADDKLPDRFFQGRVGGPAASKRADPEKLKKAKSYYYSLMGWDENGVPTPETLAALDIDWAASA
jgi:aldehyde:ferredoxin oxidoreductase